MFICDIDINKIFDLLGNLANVVAVFLSFISIKMAIRERKELRLKEQNDSIKTQTLLWYNKIVLEKLMSKISEYINGIEDLLQECKKSYKGPDLENNLKEIYSIQNEKFRLVNREIEVLKIFSNDMYYEVDDYLQEINDIFSNTINEANEKKQISLYKMRKTKNVSLKLIKCLYSYGLKETTKDKTGIV